MKRLLIVAAVCVIAAPAIAGPDVLPYQGIAGTYDYNLATGEATPASGERVLGPHIWGPTTPSGWFSSQPAAGTEVWLDWADLGDLGYTVGGFGWAYATNANHGTIDLIMVFYGDDNGWNTPGRDYIIAWGLSGLNGTVTPTNRNWYWGWIYRGEVTTPWLMTANDLDGDLLGDFSYSYWFDQAVLAGPPAYPNPKVGPLIAGDPNVDHIPGVENAFDIFNEPNYIPAPGYVDTNMIHYQGTYWFGGSPYAQFYMELMAVGCPNRGNAGRYCSADIDGSLDCVVALADLAKLLGNYGLTGAWLSRTDGDIDPYDRWFPGDDDVDLQDLAEMLGQYGDNCNWPPP
jgi:hypothetical protein